VSCPNKCGASFAGPKDVVDAMLDDHLLTGCPRNRAIGGASYDEHRRAFGPEEKKKP
jgi:hypothetical protein